MKDYKKLAAMFASLALLVTSVGIPAAQTYAAPGCSEDSFTLTSGTETLADGSAAVAAYVHPAWTASIPGATWIWDSEFVADPAATSTVSFTQDFTVGSDFNGAELMLAADNYYAVYVNGDLVASSTDVTYNAADTIDLTAYVDSGDNTLRIDVTNEAGAAGTLATDNPAGLLYSLAIDAGNCDGAEDGKAWINVVKTISGSTASSSDFTINVSALGVSTSTATSSASLLSIPGSSSGTLLTVSPGAYSVTEVAAPGFDVSYSADCSGTIAAGETVNCTVTNTAVAALPTMGHLTIIKQVINDDDGDGEASDFNLIVSGSGVSSTTASSSATSLQVAGSASGAHVYVLPGAYSVVEASHNGYDVSYSAGCSGSIAAGQSVTCVVTNNDVEDGDTNTGGSRGNNNNVNVNVNPEINVNPVFNNVLDRGFLSGDFDFEDFLDRLNDGDVLGAATTDLSCGPASRTVATGQLVRFTASGGSGDYVWTAPNMSARNGNELTVFYTQPGNSSVTVTSGGQSKTCNVAITGSVLGDSTNPGLPNTGFGGNSTLLLNLGVILALSGITTMVLRKRAVR